MQYFYDLVIYLIVDDITIKKKIHLIHIPFRDILPNPYNLILIVSFIFYNFHHAMNQLYTFSTIQHKKVIRLLF